MYVADVFNSRGLFQYLGGWISDLQDGSRAHAHTLLQRAYQVLFHLELGHDLEQAARSQFAVYAQSLPDSPTSLHCWSPLAAGLAIELSSALVAIRVLQNDAWLLATSAAGVRDAPQSMREAYKTIGQKYNPGSKSPKWLSQVPIGIRRAVAAYWEVSGETVATYRDVDQHHDVLARSCFLLTEDKGIRKVSIRLPDNPESKSTAKFTYDKKIDGFDLAKSAFAAVHELVETLARLANASQAPLQKTIEFLPAIEHQAGVARTTGLLLFDFDGKTGLIIGQDEQMHVTLTPVTGGGDAVHRGIPEK
jgi:hypothetical protein